MENSILIRKARVRDLHAIKRIADSERRTIGFVMRSIILASIKDGELTVAEDGSGLVGFVRWHRRRDGWTTAYELCVRGDRRRSGIGRILLAALARPLRGKCPVDNESNGFYRRLGLRLAGRESGKRRELNVWTLE